MFDSLVSITWDECSSIDISSIIFTLLGDFTFSIVFRKTQFIHLAEISVIGYSGMGCSAIMSHESLLDIRNSKFVGIQGLLNFGAALMMSASNASITGNNTFFDNAASSGGSIYSYNSILKLNGSNLFTNNTAHGQGRFLDSTCNYNTNTIYDAGGGAITLIKSALIVSGYSLFERNTAHSLQDGGAISARGGRVSIYDSVLFCNNYAYHGGAMFLGGVSLKFYGNVSLVNNNAKVDGGALHISYTIIIIISRNYTLSATSHASDSVSPTTIIFQQNKAAEVGGAISTEGNDNIIIFTGDVIFIANSAFNGGAIGSREILCIKFILVPILNISFIKNHANDTGGALYFGDSQCSKMLTAPIECFISILNRSSYPINGKNITLFFKHNSAGSTGSALYGGHLTECRLYYRTSSILESNACDSKLSNDFYSDDALKVFFSITKIIPLNKLNTSISSPAKQIKSCTTNVRIFRPWKVSMAYLIRYVRYQSFSVHSGQQFNITLAAIDQNDSPVPASIMIDNTSNKYRLHPLSQIINASCTNVSYRLYSSEEDKLVYFRLYLANSCLYLIDDRDKYQILDIYIQQCPIGFEIAEGDDKCTCDKIVQTITHNCYIDSNSFERTRNSFWISLTKFNNTDQLLTVYDFRCPLDYCNDRPVNVTLGDPSVQCDFNRTGILCGQCKKNFSLALGSLHCVPCDNKHVTLVLFFIMAGIVFIAMIFLLRLTVSFGTLNGLFFYANIIQANHQAFFPRGTINFFTMVISWLNLDLGIETCFYDGMDIYAYSWFQFLFPLYVWFLVGCIILTCRYSLSIAKRLGRNPVAVLATLLLMSYSKILQAIIVPLSLAHLRYYNSSDGLQLHQTIWLYEGSIDYFKNSKHIALGLFAILTLVVFILPYISLLFFGHWIQAFSNWQILSWINKLKPFMDAYHAPYKKYARYWTGLLLLTRLGLFLIFAVNANGSESINILAVSSVSVALLAIQKNIYEHRLKDILESSFILNLGVFSVATFYLKESKNDKYQLILSSISVGIAFTTFIGILLFHVILVFKSINIWKEHMVPFIQRSLFLSKIFRATDIKDNTITRNVEAAVLHALPTSTEVAIDLSKPLLLEVSADTATYD